MQKSTYLNELEVESVVRFNNDPILKEAVKKVLLAVIYNNGTLKKGEPANPTINFALSMVATSKGEVDYEKVGKDLQAMWEGICYVENGFKELEKFKPAEKKQPVKGNPAI